MKKFYIFLLIFLASLIISCDSKIDEPEITQTQKVGEKVNKLYISSPEEPISVSPNIAVSQTGLLINSFISEGLTKMGKDGDIIPGLAERWEVSEDGKIWKFYLKFNFLDYIPKKYFFLIFLDCIPKNYLNIF